MRIFFWACAIGFLSCSGDDVPFDCSKSDLAATLIQVFSASGCGIADGEIQISATSGKEPYQYALVNQSFQTSGNFSSLTPGIYSFIVRDKNGCEAFLNNITLMADDISFSADIEDNTSCTGGNGKITITMTGGTPPYLYKIGNEDFDVENEFTDLLSGNYLITVKDDADCTTEFNLTVSMGITNTSWSTEILPIMQNSCAATGCHNGVARTDLRIYANAKANAAVIKTYTQSGYMPFEGTITAGEKAKIACWVDEGALEN